MGRKRKKKYKSIRFYQVKRLRRSRKRRIKREQQLLGKATKQVDSPVDEEDYLMPPLEIATDLCPQMLAIPEPARRAVAPNRNVKPSMGAPAHLVSPMPMLTDRSGSVEIKLERTSAAQMVKQEIIQAHQATLASLGARTMKQEHPVPNVDTGNVLASLMPLRSKRGMVQYYPDRPDPKRLSNRGKVIAPMGTMPNHIMVFSQLSHGNASLMGQENPVKAECTSPIKKESRRE